MSIKIISPRHFETKISYDLCFNLRSDPNGGYAFPCDEHGNIKWTKWVDNDIVACPMEESSFYTGYRYCIEHPDEFENPYVGKMTNTYLEDAVAICKCGKEIRLWNEFYGSCGCPHCNRWYNLCGQEVVNPEQQMRCEDWDYDY